MSERVLSASFIFPVALTAPAIEQEKTFQLKKTKPEDELLFACARQNFQDEHQQRVFNICCKHKIDWALVYSTAELHGLAPLVYANLRWCQNLLIPPEILERFRLCLMRNILAKERLAENIARAVSFFAERSINVMLIKGTALDILVYDQFYYTVLQDADMIISVSREEITDRQYREFMEFFHESGLEYDYFSHHDVIMNGALPVDFRQIWAEANKVKFREQDVFVMSPEDMLLSLCINSCRKRFFRLKALCDIAETINKYPGLDWSKLVQRARTYDCHNIVYTALLVTAMTMGCSLPEGVLDALKVHPIRAKIIHYLSQRMALSSFSSLYSGNNLFGRKVDWPLLLSYATFCWYQMQRRITFVLSFTEHGQRRIANRPLA